MPISIEEVDRIAQLSRLKFSNAEKQKMAQELSQILAYMEKLNELNLAGVPATSHVIEMSNVMREDEAIPWLSSEQALQNAPARHGDFFCVPKVIRLESSKDSLGENQ